MKTDEQLKKDIEDEMSWDPAIKSAAAIGVAVDDGVVTVSGQLAAYPEKRAIERAVGRVDGVRAIAVDLEVALAPEHRRDDTDIATMAQQALAWNAEVPRDAVRAVVDNGWVTLQGKVEWEYQRRAAEKAVRSLAGVVGISNDIEIQPKVDPQSLSRRIEQALTRQALREAHRVQIDVADGEVTLRGRVHSWQERAAVQGVAWSAPGVRKVINELRIGN